MLLLNSNQKTKLANQETKITGLQADVETKSAKITELTTSLELESFAAQQLRNERESISAIHIAHNQAIKSLQQQLKAAQARNSNLRDHPDEIVKNWVNCPVPVAVSSLYKYASPASENRSANAQCVFAATGRAN